MCEQCQPATLDRRRLLRGAGALGALVAARSLWLPEPADAAGFVFETAAMGEDRMRLQGFTPAHAPSSSAGTSRASTTRQASVSAPRIVTRAEWGADESMGSRARAYAPIRKLVVHHTASSNAPRDPKAIMRAIQRFHVRDRGWSDVGYNFGIDHNGVIYEGRWARDYGAGEVHDGEDEDGYGVVGAHAAGVNTGTCGIVLIGDFTRGQPTKAALQSLVHLLAWKANRHRIDGRRTDPYVTLYGSWRSFPNISGHLHVGNTICPGPSMTQHLGWIRRSVASWAGRFPANTVNMAAAVRYRNGASPPASSRSSSSSNQASSNQASSSPSGSAAKPAAAVLGRLVGYRVLTEDGRVTSLGARGLGEPRALGISSVTSIAAVSGGRFLTLDTRGRVQAFGSVAARGNLPSGVRPADIAALPDGSGYWLLASNGGVYIFGSARWYGSPKSSGRPTGRRIHATPTGRGYWVLGDDGAIRAFGDAPGLGSPGGDIVDFCPTPSGRGYLTLDAAGRVTAFGDARRRGDLQGLRRGRWTPPAVGLVGSVHGGGYAIMAADGGIYTYGDAPWRGSLHGSGRRAVAVAAVYA